ncbi:aminomethyl-transferring glycine dehydrogenase [Chitinophaga nivalis]|uniref:Glycine dehydrogenase (decarboxylating) n=1 Tax=Chitinophaga nivalis TaxID=2991709 RepID=A0ABT3IFX8_9BACT|nr:aminomethyl-transferring glycine dehydrogenase [Chitinophaga nivalis]MCW3467450.1 aminomethyl-transferring glycine dehydrogenase [Chitinophaga nivalis]MCW3482858.1 aminomethyl-transferring glycine dehydrogenase [Chitinophaga nivalis]
MNLFDIQQNEFVHRHIGPNEAEKNQMLETIGVSDLDELINKTVPGTIRMQQPLAIPAAISESDYLRQLKDVSLKNKVFRNYIGQGYFDTITPSVILRNVFENPGWYTQYTPYQAEISQGRLESLLNYQTMVADLTGLPIANASLLDEATAAAEAMTMFFNALNKDHDHVTRPKFFVDINVYPQTLDVIYTRATPLQIEVVVGDYKTAQLDELYFGALIQYPDNLGAAADYRAFIDSVHAVNAYVGVATDLLALTLLTTPGELGADAAFGSAQRFGVPLGFGGPHAAFFAVKDDFKRSIPGRIIGVSIDAQGQRALRMALQTREQHIKREKATSNICTAQALLANMAAMYAVYHGPKGLQEIATRVTLLTHTLAKQLQAKGLTLVNDHFFDTIVVTGTTIKDAAEAAGINFRYFNGNTSISLDETTTIADLNDILQLFGAGQVDAAAVSNTAINIPASLQRTSAYLTHPVFNSYHSESLMMRYLKRLENKDLSLNTSMISLGSCTMKLNAATEMIPLSWAHWSKMHPFAPKDQVGGYLQIADELGEYLSKITGFDACSLQPNSGAQGEYAGLLVIRKFHESRGEGHRNVMLIPISAHGTNPASAVMAGFKVVVVKALENGYIDVTDLKAKAAAHAKDLAGIMITYPSTYGVYEESVKEICAIIHENGGQVYMDGANMNAQVGLTAPGLIGADVCHLNLHKTFAIPHGGGGPGMGPICVAKHLAPFLPGHVFLNNGELSSAVSAAPFGSASILLISYAYIRMLGADGVKQASRYAILNANYMKTRLEKAYDILYNGVNGTCAHEFIVDLRPFKSTAGIEAEDVAKRLMDYGFHAPTLSFPVPGTIMIEPTESEDKGELDRFCDALLSIREEIRAVEEGRADKQNNVLKHAPHTQAVITADEWNRPYGRQQAAFPLEYVKANKFWPSISRVNNTHGDRNLICTCEPVSAYEEAVEA